MDTSMPQFERVRKMISARDWAARRSTGRAKHEAIAEARVLRGLLAAAEDAQAEVHRLLATVATKVCPRCDYRWTEGWPTAQPEEQRCRVSVPRYCCIGDCEDVHRTECLKPMPCPVHVAAEPEEESR